MWGVVGGGWGGGRGGRGVLWSRGFRARRAVGGGVLVFWGERRGVWCWWWLRVCALWRGWRGGGGGRAAAINLPRPKSLTRFFPASIADLTAATSPLMTIVI